MPDLKEHFELILWLVGALFSALLLCLGYIAKQVTREMQSDREQREKAMTSFAHKLDKVEEYLESITNELFERMRKAENSLSSLWAEHRTIKDMGACGYKYHRKEDEHG